jgi:DNA-binding protein H-NS
MDIATLSIAELKDLLVEVPKEIKRREKGEKARVRKEIEALAANAGFSLDELLSEAEENTKTRKPVAVKYRHPNDASLEWTGRGRQPRWVGDFLASGGSIEQLAI